MGYQRSDINLTPFRPLADLLVRHGGILTVVLVGLFVRCMVFQRFEFVSYDGTAYINQAASLLEGQHSGGAFPIGYPLAIAVFLPIFKDGVLAAQLVSCVSSVIAMILLYALARQFVGVGGATLCSLILGLNPLFLRLSVMTMSESLYIFFVILGLYCFRRNAVLFGTAMGLAAITRPEALGIFGILLLLRLRYPKQILLMLLAFLPLYFANVAVISKTVGKIVILPKAGNFDRSAAVQELGYSSVEDGVLVGVDIRRREEKPPEHLISHYLSRAPKEFAGLIRFGPPIAFLLALFGILRKPNYTAASLVPFLFLPAVAIRSDPRFLLPYLPVIILYALIGLDSISNRNLRTTGRLLLYLSIPFHLMLESNILEKPREAQIFENAREVGTNLHQWVHDGDRVADCKPYVAFFAGAQYMRLPIGSYNGTIRYLLENNAEFLSLHVSSTRHFAPQLEPLLFDPPAIRGEVRFQQIIRGESGELIYERVRDFDSLVWTRLTESGSIGPSWSPDGELIAYRAVQEGGNGGLYVISSDGHQVSLVKNVDGGSFLSWSPDSRRVAFSQLSQGNVDIFAVDVHSGDLSRLTDHPGIDSSPSWAATNELAFRSSRSGNSEIWIKNLTTKELTQVTRSGGNRFPAISRDGRMLAWVDEDRRLQLLDREDGEVIGVKSPKPVSYPPSWSPCNKYLVVESHEWGSLDIYLVRGDGLSTLLLTKKSNDVGMPCWSPEGNAIAVVSRFRAEPSVWILTGINPYLDRLETPHPFKFFEKGATPTFFIGDSHDRELKSRKDQE